MGDVLHFVVCYFFCSVVAHSSDYLKLDEVVVREKVMLFGVTDQGGLLCS